MELIRKDGHPVEQRASNAAISVRGLTVSYGESPVVFSVDADLPQGQMTAIVGPNGAGKSTFLKAVLGVVPRLSGQVSVVAWPYSAFCVSVARRGGTVGSVTTTK